MARGRTRGRGGHPARTREAIPLREGLDRRPQALIFERTSRFKRAAKRLAPSDQERLAKSLLLYERDPAHPSLRIKRIQGTRDIWEGRVGDAVRFTFQKIEGGILLRNVGMHDPTLKRP